LVMLEGEEGARHAGRYLRASDLIDNLGQENNPEWKTIGLNSDGELVSPLGSIGYRWGEKGKWNLEQKNGTTGAAIDLTLTLKDSNETCKVGFDYFGHVDHPHFTSVPGEAIQQKTVPCKTITLADGSTAIVATVFDLTVANLGVDNGVGGEHVTDDYNDATVPGTPAWQEVITGLSRERVIQVAREFAENAHKTHGKSMIIIGAGMNHWYHLDMNYRGVINMLMLCGCIGKSGGGWAHYVGQEKLRPQTGWLPLAFALDWHRPPRHMNGTSYFYAHSNQWKYERLRLDDILSPLAERDQWSGSMIDLNVRAERMGWLPTSPQFETNPLEICKAARAAGKEPAEYALAELTAGRLRMSCEDSDNPKNYTRNMIVWLSNLFGASGKGHEDFLKLLLEEQQSVLMR